MKKRILVFNFILFLVGSAMAQNQKITEPIAQSNPSTTNECDPFTVPYLEDFENTNVGSTPPCFTFETTDGTWIVEDLSNTPLPWNKMLMFYYDWSGGDYDEWFFLPGIEMQAGENYLLEYYYGGESPYEVHRKNIWIGTMPESGEMTNEIADFPEFSGEEKLEAEIIFTVPQDGVYYVGFHLYSEQYNGNVFLDHIKLNFAPTCLTPTDLAVAEGSLTTSSADVVWNPGEDESGWLVKYGTPDFDPNTEGEELTTSAPQASLTNLPDDTPFEVYVKAICDDDESTWSNPLLFWTACHPTTVPFFQDFEGVTPPNVPNCATLENAGTGNNWDVYNDPYYGFYSNVLRYNYDYDNAANAWYYTQGIEMEANKNYYIKYKYANNASYTTEKLRVGLMSETSSTSLVEELADHPSIQNQIVYTNEVVFTVPSDGVYYFGFNAYSDQNNYFLLVDDIEIDEAPSCLKPTEVYTDDDNITQTSALISWQDANNASQWEIVFGAPGFDPENEGTTVTINNDTPEGWIENLSPGTTYEVYVRTICSDDDESPLSYSTEFTTECDIATVPYLEDFEDAPVPDVPNCATLENNAYGNDWKTVIANQSGFDSKVLVIEVHCCTPSDSWYFTKQIQMEAGVEYTISYDYGIYSWMPTPDPERFKVVLTNAPTSAADYFEEIADHPNVVELELLNNTVTFTVSETDTYNIGFNFYSGNHNTGELYIDNIMIDYAPCAEPTDIEVNDVEPTEAQISWAPGNEESQWDVVYGPAGFDPQTDGTTMQVEGEPLVVIEDLTPQTEYDVYVVAVCHENNKSDATGPATFETDALPCIEPNDVTVTDVENHTALVTWTAGGSEDNWEVNYGISPFNPDEEGTVMNVSGQMEATLQDLEGGSNYDVYVRSICESENSDWTDPVPFTTTTVGLNDAQAISFAVYPNPFDDKLKLTTETLVEKIAVYDLTGRKILETKPYTHTTEIPMQHLAPGIYLMEIFSNYTSVTTRIVKK